MNTFLRGLGATAVVTLLGITPTLAMSFPVGGGGRSGGPAGAPEIGAGIAGMVLAVAAVKYFRQRARD